MAEDSDADYEELPQRPRQSKRQKILHALKATAKQLEELLKLVSGGSKTSELYSIPAHEIKEEDFRHCYGMVEFRSQMPSYDRFRVIETPDATLSCIAGLVGGDVSYSTAFEGSDGGEQQDSPILDRLFRALGRFTRPRKGQEDEVTFEQEEQAAMDHQAVKKADLAMSYAQEAEITSRPSEEVESSDDQEHLVVRPQASTAAAAATRQHADLKLSVYSIRNTVRGLRLRVIDDFKTFVMLRNLLQGATYGIQDLQDTASYPKVYRPPVYVMAQNRRTWCYGILEIDGYIRVKDGEIVATTLEAFPKEHQAVDSKKFTSSLTQDKVLEKFQAWKATMLENGMYIPEDRLHPVGRLFCRTVQNYEVPSLTPEQTLLSGQKRFYDGLLKILVGRRVTKWSVEDVIHAWNARKSMKEVALKTAGCPESYLPTLCAM